MVSPRGHRCSQAGENATILSGLKESSGQEKLYTLEGARLVGYKDDYAAYVAYRMTNRPISMVIGLK